MKTAGILALLAVMAMATVDAGVGWEKRSLAGKSEEDVTNFLLEDLQNRSDHVGLDTYPECMSKCKRAAKGVGRPPKSIRRTCDYVCEISCCDDMVMDNIRQQLKDEDLANSDSEKCKSKCSELSAYRPLPARRRVCNPLCDEQ